jgi:hypothetical protein
MARPGPLYCGLMKNPPRAPLPLLALALLLAASAAAAENTTQDILFRWDPRLWGADVAWGYKGWELFRGVDTVLWASAGAGYQSANFYQLYDDSGVAEEPRFNPVGGDWRLGVAQGIVYNLEQNRNLVEALLLYRGKYQKYLNAEAIPPSYPDQTGILQNSFLTGLVFDTSLKNEQFKTKRGIYSALTLELVPGWVGNDILGDSDYSRLGYIAEGYLPVHESRLVSVYLADRVMFDYLFGDTAHIPISATGSFGALTSVPIGSNPIPGLGGSLRGVPGERFDGLVKAVNNFDVRLHFPALTLFDLVTPGLTFYFDAGVYDRMSRSLRFDPVYTSVGAGLVLYALGFDFVLYGDYFITEPDFSVSLGLGAHF